MSRLEQPEPGALVVRTMRQDDVTIQELDKNAVQTWKNKAILMMKLQHKTEKSPDQNLLSRKRLEQQEDQ